MMELAIGHLNVNDTGAHRDATGEGSRGGRIVGHTSSGKPIYMNHGHPAHKDFTQKDHHEAAMLHSKKGDKAGKAIAGTPGHSPQKQQEHYSQASRHLESGGLEAGQGSRMVPKKKPVKIPQIKGLGESMGGKSALAGFVNKRK